MSRILAANANRIESKTPLTEEAIRHVAPSIFATEARSDRSSRYAYIPTSEVLAGLAQEGFQPFMVAQARTLDPQNRSFVKHVIRLRHASEIQSQEAHEVVLTNSHDGGSSYKMLSGVIRFVCMNGLIVGDSIETVTVQHQGRNVRDRVIEGAYTVLSQAEKVRTSVDEMKGVELTRPEQTLFAEAALQIRYPDAEKAPPVAVERFLNPRRAEDTGRDLWRTFNRVQESAIRGGVEGYSPETRSRFTTRPVEGIDQRTGLNRALWTLAEGMKALKNGGQPAFATA